MCWFDMPIKYYKMIITAVLANTATMSHNYKLFL